MLLKYLAVGFGLSAIVSNSGETLQPQVPVMPFDAAIYSVFAMPYNEPPRKSETISLHEGIKRLNINFLVPKLNGLKQLGVWYNSKNSDERYGANSPELTIIYTLDSPGAPTPSIKTAAIVYQVTKVNLTESQIQKNQKDFLGSATTVIRKVGFSKGIVYGHCTPWYFDYPALSKQIKTTCQSLYLSKNIYIRTSAVNLPLNSSIHATMELVKSMR